MITDAQLRFDNNAAVTVTATSTNVIDLISTANSQRGKPLRLVSEVFTGFTAGGAATLQAQLVQSATANLASPTVLVDSGAIPVATLVAGYRILDAIIPRTSQEFLGVIYTVATGPMTGGTLWSGIVVDSDSPLADRQDGNVSFSAT